MYFERASCQISKPDNLFHLSPRTLPTSVNAIPGLLFFIFCNKKKKHEQASTPMLNTQNPERMIGSLIYETKLVKYIDKHEVLDLFITS